jgi:hypothetical protein
MQFKSPVTQQMYREPPIHVIYDFFNKTGFSTRWVQNPHKLLSVVVSVKEMDEECTTTNIQETRNELPPYQTNP